MPGWKIDFLATAPASDPGSGLSRVIWELASALTSRGHSVRVMYPTDGPSRPPVSFRGVEAVPLILGPMSRRPFGRDIAAGKAASRAVRPGTDLFIGNDEKAGALDLPSRGPPQFAMIIHDVALHTFDTVRPLEPDRGLRQRIGNWLDRGTLRRLEGGALARAKLILVASQLSVELLQRYYRIPASRVHILPDGVPDPLEGVDRSAARQSFRIPLDVPTVLFVGRTPLRQGLDLALDAFRRIRMFFPGARLLVVGSTTPAEHGVIPLGYVDEATKAKAYAAADIFLFPSRYEGFGLAPREAMRYGLPVITSRHVPLEGLHGPKDLRVIPTDDPADYASELAELLADPALRREMGAAGKAWADQFSYGKMAERFETLFRPIVGR